jgi:hypothetical protein
MGEIITWVIGKLGYVKRPKSGNVLSESDLQKSLETRRLQASVRNLEKQAEIQKRLQNLDAVFNPKEKPEEILIKCLVAKMMGNMTDPTLKEAVKSPIGEFISDDPQKNLSEFGLSKMGKRELSDKEVKQIVKANTQYMQYATGLKDEEIINTLKKFDNNLTEDSYKRIVQEVRILNGC